MARCSVREACVTSASLQPYRAAQGRLHLRRSATAGGRGHSGWRLPVEGSQLQIATVCCPVQACSWLQQQRPTSRLLQGVLAYVILRPLMSLVGFVAALFGAYGDGVIRYDKAYVYTTFVNNCSQVRELLMSPSCSSRACAPSGILSH